ncbi:hypothetical protein MRX96_030204 [Rhipicephalus microplus]
MRSMDAAAYRGFIISGGFKQLLPEEVWGDFERGGYYSLQLSKEHSSGVPQHCAVVFISGHIGPGFFLRSLPGEPANILFFDDVNDGYQDLISDYKGRCGRTVFRPSARTCLRLTIRQSRHASKLCPFDRDYTVYYLDLQKANMAAASKQVPRWERLYSAKDDFSLQDLSTTFNVRTGSTHFSVTRPAFALHQLRLVPPRCGTMRRRVPSRRCCAPSWRPGEILHAACLGRGDEGHSAHGLPVKDGAETLPTVRDVTVGLTVSASVVAGIVLLVIAKRARMMRAQHYGRFI